jgi:VanZ family protein
MKKRLFWIGTVILWMGIIFLLSSEVSNRSSERSGAIVHVLSQSTSIADNALTFLTRKAAHIFVYFVLGILMYTAVRHYATIRRAIIASIIFCGAYAVSDEIHQLFVPGRSGEIRDILIDSIAAATGVILCYFLNRIIFSSKNSKNKL